MTKTMSPVVRAGTLAGGPLAVTTGTFAGAGLLPSVDAGAAIGASFVGGAEASAGSPLTSSIGGSGTCSGSDSSDGGLCIFSLSMKSIASITSDSFQQC